MHGQVGPENWRGILPPSFRGVMAVATMADGAVVSCSRDVLVRRSQPQQPNMLSFPEEN